MHERSQISIAVTELVIGAENLENTDASISKDFTEWSPNTTYNVEKEEADAKQETNPGHFCGQEDAQLPQVQISNKQLLS